MLPFLMIRISYLIENGKLKIENENLREEDAENFRE